MIPFEIVEAEGGTAGGYQAGLFAMPDGTRRGIETLAAFEPGAANARNAPDVLGSLRGALPEGSRLTLPLRLAVSTIRAGLGVIEEGLAPSGLITVELSFADGSVVSARMPPALVATIRRDREIVAQALARTGQRPSAGAPESEAPLDAETDEALTSIFRYEKRNGRLRRVAVGK